MGSPDAMQGKGLAGGITQSDTYFRGKEMQFKSNALRDAIIFALVAGTGTLGYASTAGAQAQANPQGTSQSQPSSSNQQPGQIDRIEVTGTRIRQVDTETTQPVTLIDREDIEKQGFQSVADILQNISATGTPPISRASPLSAGENSGGTFISLRNLGAARTLILLNGKRLGISTSGLADISTIPAAAVERIEVLKDGASSIYGSDAIAGVINIITRSKFTGGSASAYLGQYDQGDGKVKNGDFVGGVNNDRLSITIGGEVRDEEAVFARDRDFSAFPRSSLHPTDNWTTVGQFGGFTTTAANPVAGFPTGTRLVLRPGGNPRVLADYIAQDQNIGSCAPPAASGTTGCVPGSTAFKSNTNLQTDLRTPVSATSLFFDGILNFNDDIRLRVNALYSDRDSSRTVAGYPMQAGSFAPTAPGMSALSYFNPTGLPITTWWRRTWEVPRVSEANLKTYRMSAAIEGSFQLADRYFDWDVGFLWNENKQRQVTFGNLNTPRTQRAVGPSFLNAQGRVQCGTALAPIPFSECVPFNPFLPFGVEGQGGLTNNRELQAYLFQPSLATGETKTQVFSANLSGSVISLPAGDLGFAVGLERREESGAFNPDPLDTAGLTTNLASGPTRGAYSVDEAYLELEVPLLADIPFAKELTLSLASRYSDYDTFGNATNNKIGLKYRPIESLLLRATANDGFRAPTIADLYGGTSQTFANYTDPCDVVFGQSTPGSQVRQNCTSGPAGVGAVAATLRQRGQGNAPVTGTNAQTPFAFNQGSNPFLIPEVSRSQTMGFVWSPNFLEGFNLAVDWWKIRITDTIVQDSPNAILNDCYVQNIASRCSSSLFTRDPVQGNVITMNYGNRNAGFRKVEGFDVDLSYRFKTGIGDFSAVSNSTYTVREYLVNTNDPTIPVSTVSIAGAGGANFRIRSNLNLGWQYGDFGINWMARYYSGLKETCAYVLTGSTTPNLECQELLFAPNGAIRPDGSPASTFVRRKLTGSVTFNDVQFRWNTPWSGVVTLGANNVFEKYGPVMYTQPAANVSYYGGWDIGRFVYIRYTQKFGGSKD